MTANSSTSGFAGDFLLSRLFNLVRRLKGVDPDLTRILVPWVAKHPRHVPGVVRLVRSYAHAQRLRSEARDQGLQVPPFLILSVTSKCNLRCTGCYAGANGTVSDAPSRASMQLEQWYQLVEEASQLGVIAFIVAGGEPFMLPGIANLFRDHPDRLFLVFTNGTALRPADHEILRDCPNTVVVVSVEGNRDLTNQRRGVGVFEKALGSLDQLQKAGVLTGISVTVSPINVKYWCDPHNIDALIAHSGPLALFLEEIPTSDGSTEGSVLLSPEQRRRFREVVLEYRNRQTGGAYIIHSPDDEETLGGCVSAGRGFAHISPAGDVTACPVSALATHNVRTSNLREALDSPFFSMIRANQHLLETEGHPCGLSAHTAELEKMAAGLGAYRTGARETEKQGTRSLVSLR